MIAHLEKIIWAFEVMPLKDRVGFISAVFMFFGAFYMLVISPIIFNFYLIPNIEKRIGKYLRYDPLWGYMFLGMWMMPAFEVSGYIVRRYFALVFKGEHGLPEKRNRFALKKIGFTIDMATKFEIIMSFAYIINVIIIGVFAIIGLFATGQLSLFAHPQNSG